MSPRTVLSELAPAKLNLALHVRGRLPDGRHAIETIFAFCTDGDRLSVEGDGRTREGSNLGLTRVTGPFALDLPYSHANLVTYAARQLAEQANLDDAKGAIHLEKLLPVAAGIGGGSADAAATLRLLTRLWGIDPAHANAVAPKLGADVPACLLSMTARGEGAGDELQLFDDPSIAGTLVLLVNPGVELSTREVFRHWDGIDRGPLGPWREGRNDLEAPARELVPEIGDVLDWLARRDGANFVRMSGSGATCFALFDSEAARDVAAAECPPNWWHLATFLR